MTNKQNIDNVLWTLNRNPVTDRFWESNEGINTETRAATFPTLISARIFLLE